MIKRPEILSPAGDPEKLRAALLYGADAVYLAGKSFGMRAASDNFSVEELKAAAEHTHSLGNGANDGARRIVFCAKALNQDAGYCALSASEVARERYLVHTHLTLAYPRN